MLAAAATAACVLGGAGPAQAAHAAAATRITISVSPHTAVAGQKVSVTGKVTPGGTGTLALAHLVAGHWVTLAHQAVPRSGVYAFSTKVSGAGTSWPLRVTRATTPAARAGASAPVAVHVARTAFALHVTSAAHTVPAGGRLVVSGTVTPKAAGSVTLQVLGGKTWKPVTSAPLAATRFSLHLTTPPGRYRLRVTKSATATVAAGASTPFVVTFAAPEPAQPTTAAPVTGTPTPAPPTTPVPVTTTSPSPVTSPAPVTTTTPAGPATPGILDLPAGRTVTDISTAPDHACAVLDNGQAVCWGYNGSDGLLGNNSTTRSGTPVAVDLPAGRTATDISVGRTMACAVLDNGAAYCWGAGTLGDGSTTGSRTPVAVTLPTGRTATAVTVGPDHACLRLDDGSAACWGGNRDGALGDASTTGSSTPVLVHLPAGRTVAAISAGSDLTCATMDNASAWCWGYNYYGGVGDGSSVDSRTVPTAVHLPAGRTVTDIGASDDAFTCEYCDPLSAHACAVLDNGQAYCWGYEAGTGGYLGGPTAVVVPLPSGRRAVTVATGAIDDCVLLDDGTVSCGGTTGGRTSAPLPAGRTATELSAGQSQNCAVLDKGDGFCWGKDDDGQLGDNPPLAAPDGLVSITMTCAPGDYTFVIHNGTALNLNLTWTYDGGSNYEFPVVAPASNYTVDAGGTEPADAFQWIFQAAFSDGTTAHELEYDFTPPFLCGGQLTGTPVPP